MPRIAEAMEPSYANTRHTFRDLHFVVRPIAHVKSRKALPRRAFERSPPIPRCKSSLPNVSNPVVRKLKLVRVNVDGDAGTDSGRRSGVGLAGCRPVKAVRLPLPGMTARNFSILFVGVRSVVGKGGPPVPVRI